MGEHWGHLTVLTGVTWGCLGVSTGEHWGSLTVSTKAPWGAFLWGFSSALQMEVRNIGHAHLSLDWGCKLLRKTECQNQQKWINVPTCLKKTPHLTSQVLPQPRPPWILKWSNSTLGVSKPHTSNLSRILGLKTLPRTTFLFSKPLLSRSQSC